MTRQELEALVAETRAAMLARAQAIEAYNNKLRWWESGNKIHYKAPSDIPSHSQWQGTVPLDSEYSMLGGRLNEYQKQLATLQEQERLAQLAKERQALASGTVVPVTQSASTSTTTEVPVEGKTQGSTEGEQATADTAATRTEVPTTQAVERKRVVPTLQENKSLGFVEQTGNGLPMSFGQDFYAIPSNGFTSAGNVYGAPIRIDPVNSYQDNGGLQHADMNMLYQNTPATFGQALAFANLMQGKKGLSGGIAAMTNTMRDTDTLNAYAAQEEIAGRVQGLMRDGYGANEARYLALSEYGLQNGLDRMAVGITMPEYTKFADERAKRDLDTTVSAGGNYQALGGLGYTPLGIRTAVNTGVGYDFDINGQAVTDVPYDYASIASYGAVKGDGSGLSNAATRYVDNEKTRMQLGTSDISEEYKLRLAEMGYPVSSGKGLSLQDRMALKAYDTEEYIKRKQAEHEIKNGTASGTGSAYTFRRE